jgi:hypothetical protein
MGAIMAKEIKISSDDANNVSNLLFDYLNDYDPDPVEIGNAIKAIAEALANVDVIRIVPAEMVSP